MHGRFEAPLRWVTSALFLGMGVSHFVATDYFVGIMPPWLPWPRALVLFTGGCEIAGAAGLQIPRLRRAAGACLIVLLFAVLPANVQEASAAGRATAWLRLPLQLVFVALVWSVALRRPGAA